MKNLEKQLDPQKLFNSTFAIRNLRSNQSRNKKFCRLAFIYSTQNIVTEDAVNHIGCLQLIDDLDSELSVREV